MGKGESINFSKEQIKYLMDKTGANSPQEAIEIFAIILRTEYIDISKMIICVNKLMNKDGHRYD